MNIEKIAAHQIDPVRDIWMKGSSQGNIRGWIQTFEIEEKFRCKYKYKYKTISGSGPLKQEQF